MKSIALILGFISISFGLMSKRFANGPGDRGSIPGRVIPKTQKYYLITPCLTRNTIRYVSRVKWHTPRKGAAPPLELGVVAIQKVAYELP